MPTSIEHSPRILVLGSSGFIGSRVAASLAGSGRSRVIALARRPGNELQGHNVSTAAADISALGSLEPFIDGIDVVIHAASYVGSDPNLAWECNELGTRNVIAQCRRAGVPRVIYVSTCSVYGSGPHRALVESKAVYNPASVASATRASAEQMVLDYGGEAIRPNLVFGKGDRWFVPGLLKIMEVTGGWPGDGNTLLSLIGVETLGHLIAGLALSPGQPGQAFHAAYPEPVPVSSLLEGVADAFGTSPAAFLGRENLHAENALRTAGFSRHQVDLITTDHWYSSDRLWRISGYEPREFCDDLSELTAC